MSNKRKKQIRRKKTLRHVAMPANSNKAKARVMTDEEAQEHRRAHQETVETRMRLYGVSEGVARGAEVGHSLGRLLLNQVTTQGMSRETMSDYLSAGAHFAHVVTQYEQDVLDMKKSTPSAMNMNAVGGRSCREIDADHIQAITNQWMAIHGCLLFEKGRGIYHALKTCCVEDEDTFFWPDRQVKDLLKGLELISGMLTMGRKSGTHAGARRIAS